MRRRAPARLLASAALVTCAVAVYAIVHHETQSGGKRGKASSSSTSTTPTTTTTTGKRKTTAKAKTYTVKSGDVLSAIAIKTGSSVADLQRLNPSMDASTLHPGQKLKLPR
jgi:LysM repeat protein